MTGEGYAIESFATDDGPRSDKSSPVTGLTALLGCQHTTVEGYTLHDGESVELTAEDEHVWVVVGGGASLTGDGTHAVKPPGVGRVPAGVAGTIRCEREASVVVVGASASPTPNAAPSAYSLEDCQFTLPSTSAIATARLTRLLGCQGMKVNARLLEPGQVVPYHTEGEQEELFLPVNGRTAMRIADRKYETPPGTVVRVAPDVPRSAINDGDTDSLWVLIGAPPTGGPDEWDPGAEILEQ